MTSKTIETLCVSFEALLWNIRFISRLQLAIITVGNLLLFSVANNWIIVAFIAIGLFSSFGYYVTYCKSINLMVSERNQSVLLYSVLSYCLLIISVLPIVLFLYLNQNWALLVNYGIKSLVVLFKMENLLLPVSITMLFSAVYWFLTILIYRESYLYYLCINKKKEIYE